MKSNFFTIFVMAKLLILSLIIVSTSCIKREEFPVVPYIEFKDFKVLSDTIQNTRTGILVLTFTDGDGDIGLSPSDTLHPYNRGSDYFYNFFLKFYRKENNTFVEFPLNPPFNGRIPPINPDDYPQNLKGEIAIQIDAAGLYFAFQKNPFKIEVLIYDRALNKSNVVLSPALTLP